MKWSNTHSLGLVLLGCFRIYPNKNDQWQLQYTSRSKWNRLNTVESSWVFPCGYNSLMARSPGWCWPIEKDYEPLPASQPWWSSLPTELAQEEYHQIHKHFPRKTPHTTCVSILNFSTKHLYQTCQTIINYLQQFSKNHHFSTVISDFTNINQFHPNQQSCVPDPDTAACNSRRTRSAPDCKASAAALPWRPTSRRQGAPKRKTRVLHVESKSKHRGKRGEHCRHKT